MTNRFWIAALLLAALGVGCASAGDPTVALDAPPGSPAIGVNNIGISREMVGGLYALNLDLAAGQAKIELVAPRAGQATDDLFSLSLRPLLRHPNIAATAIRVTDDRVEVDYIVRHPVPAPTDPAGEPSASNRADLGFAGRLLLLADVQDATGRTFFKEPGSPSVIADTGLVVNADGYYRPAGLLDLPDYTATTFPYQVLVDERGFGNRSGVGNGEDPRGNYHSASGWWRADMGSAHNAWTGYGVLHQGQQVSNTLVFDRSRLEAGPVQFLLAVIARYNDPRGGTTQAEKQANRLPPPTPDFTKFAYRMPHGSLDCERIEILGIGPQFDIGQESASSLAVRVTDWDARMIETEQADLGDDPHLSRVAIGESGPPTLAVSIPGILDIGDGSGVVTWDLTDLKNDDSAYPGGDANQDSGRAGDGLYYTRNISKPAADSGIVGTYTGLIRATDPETGIVDPDFVVELDETLSPLASELPESVTYQAFKVVMDIEPGWIRMFGTSEAGESGMVIRIDHQGNFILAGQFDSSDFDLGGGPKPAFGQLDIFVVKLDPNLNHVWDVRWGSGFDDGPMFIVPDESGNLFVSVDTGGSIDFGAGERPSGGHIVALTPDGLLRWDRPAAVASPSGGPNFDVSADGSRVYESGIFYNSADFGGGERTSVGGSDMFLVTYEGASGAYRWDRTWGSPANENGVGPAISPEGNLYLYGSHQGPLDLGGGVRAPAGIRDGFVVGLAPADGSWIWDHRIGAPGALVSVSLDFDAAGDLMVIGQQSEAPVDFGGGPRPLLNDVNFFIAKYRAADRAYVWDYTFGMVPGGGFGEFEGLLTTGAGSDGQGGYLLSGFSFGTYDLGGGTRGGSLQYTGFLLHIDGNGNYAWDRAWSATGPEQAHMIPFSLTADPEGAIYLCGWLYGDADADPGPEVFPVTGPWFDMFLMRLRPNGLWY